LWTEEVTSGPCWSQRHGTGEIRSGTERKAGPCEVRAAGRCVWRTEPTLESATNYGLCVYELSACHAGLLAKAAAQVSEQNQYSTLP